MSVVPHLPMPLHGAPGSSAAHGREPPPAAGEACPLRRRPLLTSLGASPGQDPAQLTAAELETVRRNAQVGACPEPELDIKCAELELDIKCPLLPARMTSTSVPLAGGWDFDDARVR